MTDPVPPATPERPVPNPPADPSPASPPAVPLAKPEPWKAARESKQEKGAGQDETSTIPVKWQLGIALSVLVAFFIVGVILIATAEVSDGIWKNRLAVFNSFEAIVFTAVGWLFGREVMRGKAEVAKESAERSENHAADAKAVAATAKESERQQTDARIAAEQEVASERVRGSALAAGIMAGRNGGVGPSSSEGGRASEVSDGGVRGDALRDLALHLYPEMRH